MDGYPNFNYMCSINTSYSYTTVTTTEEMIIINPQVPNIPQSPSMGHSIGQNHNQDSCPCREEIKVLKKTVDQLSSKLEKQEHMFCELRASFEAHLTKVTSKAQKFDKGTQTQCTPLQTSKDINANMITVAESSETKKEHRDDLVASAVIIEEMQDNEEETVRFPRAIRKKRQTVEFSKVKMANNDNKNNDKQISSDNTNLKNNVGSKPCSLTTDRFQCSQCSKSFKHKSSVRHHEKSHAEPIFEYECGHCFKQFKRKSALTEHIKSVHRSRRCPLCPLEFINISHFNAHVKSHSQQKVPIKLLTAPSRPPSQAKDDNGNQTYYYVFA